MKTIFAVIGLAFAAVGVAIVIATLMSIPVYYLWNWLMPELFNLKTITFFQAWGLMALSSCLFKSTASSTSK
jgi:hypothetical protein